MVECSVRLEQHFLIQLAFYDRPSGGSLSYSASVPRITRAGDSGMNSSSLNCEYFIQVGFVSLFVCYSYVAPKLSFEWNKEVFDLT